jgi:putative ABC transport system permease protein
LSRRLRQVGPLSDKQDVPRKVAVRICSSVLGDATGGAAIVLKNDEQPIIWATRTAVEPYSLRMQIQGALQEASGGLAVARVRSMEEVVRHSTARSDFIAILLAAFAGISLLLAAIGVYGLMAFSIRQRRREIAVRVALGATSDRVVKMVLWQGVRLAMAGILIGTALSFGFARSMQTLIYGIKPIDPAVICISSFTLTVVAAVACYVPACRASRVDPAIELRSS